MKLIHLNLKRECVLVELPEGAKNIRTGDWGNFVYDSPIEGVFAIDTLVPLAYRKFLGKLTDLKEEDFEGLVHRSGHYSDLYKSYNPKDVRPYSFGRESFISAIEAEGLYTENPYAKTIRDAVDKSPGSSYEEKLKEADIYREAQEKVINLSNCFLFVKS
jgi:hypothetical protein